MQELTLGMGVHVSVRLVAVLMSMNRIATLLQVELFTGDHGVQFTSWAFTNAN
jgi:hypothetical protein